MKKGKGRVMRTPGIRAEEGTAPWQKVGQARCVKKSGKGVELV